MTAQRRRRPTWLAGLLALALSCLASLILSPPAVAAPDPAVNGFAGCLVSQRQGDVVLLFDQSDSIGENDPQDARITAADNLVRQLSRWATDRNVDLQVQVAGFAADYAASTTGWVPVRDDGAADQLQSAVREIAVEDGFETDYWNGLEGARAALAERQDQGSDRCQAVVWFSDGAFALNPRDSSEEVDRYGEVKVYARDIPLLDRPAVERAERIAVEDLCRSGGPANQLRAADVTIFGIGLSGPRTQDSAFALMRRITENVSGDCGSLQEPPGRFWPVSNVDELIAAFDQVLNNGQELREFVLDQALTRVHILGTGAEGLRYALVGPPGGDPLTLEYSTEEQQAEVSGVDGVSVRWTWLSPGTVVVDLDRAPEADWTGLWQVRITDANDDPSGDPPLVSFTGDLFPSWSPDNAPLLVSGETPQVRLGLTHTDGEPFPADQVPGEIALSAVLVDARGRSHPIVSEVGKEAVTEPVPLDLSDAAVGEGTVELSLVYTTATISGSSTTLDAQELPVPVRVLPPLDRGEIVGELDYGEIEDVADTEASVTLSGPSCAWIAGEATTTAHPAGVTPSLTSPHMKADECLRVESGDSASFPVRLRTGTAGNGNLIGTVPVNLAPLDEPDKAVSVDVPFRADMRNPLDVTVTAWVFLLALALGVGIPLGLLYLVKWLTATMPNRALEAVRIPVTVAAGQVLFEGRPLTIENAPAASPVTFGRGRRLADAVGVALRSRTGASPFTPSWVAATLPGHVGASSFDDEPRGKERAAALPLGVHNTWVVFHDPLGPPDQATLVLLRGLDITDGQRRESLDEARRGLPDLVSRLRAAATPEGGGHGAAPPPPGPSGGGWGSGSFGSAPGPGVPPTAPGGGWSTSGFTTTTGTPAPGASASAWSTTQSPGPSWSVGGTAPGPADVRDPGPARAGHGGATESRWSMIPDYAAETGPSDGGAGQPGWGGQSPAGPVPPSGWPGPAEQPPGMPGPAEQPPGTPGPAEQPPGTPDTGGSRWPTPEPLPGSGQAGPTAESQARPAASTSRPEVPPAPQPGNGEPIDWSQGGFGDWPPAAPGPPTHPPNPPHPPA